MKKVAFLVLVFVSLDSWAQKGVFLELAGSGGLGSLNYENVFTEQEKVNFGWRAGIAAIPIDKNTGMVVTFPLLFNTLIGGSAHKIELGAGQGLSITTKGAFFVRAPLVAGYRYQHPDKKFFYRVAYTPLVSYIIDLQYQHWFGASIGITLNKKEDE